jgi:RNA-directed DNA polymerase
MADPKPTHAPPATRQELYDRIRTSSKDEVVLQEMIRLGFWDADLTPADPADEQARITQLERRVRALGTEAARTRSVDAIKAELKRRRMADARARRQLTAERREERRRQKALAWAARKERELLWLGPGVSGTLSAAVSSEGDPRPLHAGIPPLPDPAAVAAAAGVTVGALRFLTFHRGVSATTHYRRFLIPKKTGGTRRISAPLPRLKALQRWVLQEVLSKVPVHDAAHGFVPGRSIVTNAQPHVGRRVVVNFDLQDFFPTITYPRVWGLFRSLGYPPATCTVLALATTEPLVDEIQLDGRRWFVHRSERHLPQGSPCSPVITNLLCRRLDQRLTGLARKLGMTYTRYADDLTFSGDPDALSTLLGAVRAIVLDEGFRLNAKKTHVMRRAGRQEVTGLVVNDRVGVPRRFLRRHRAVLFQVRRDGPAGKKFGASSDVVASLLGFAAFAAMVDPDGVALLEETRAAVGWTRKPPRPPPPPPPPPAPEPPPAAAAAPPPAEPEPPPKPAAKWWEFWKW